MPASRWGDVIAVCEAMGWSYEEYLAAPMELVDEIMVRANAKAQWEREQRRNDTVTRATR